MSIKNDVSFLIDSALNLYEHQSTYSPNMPLRGLFYFSDILRNYVEEQQLDLYSSKKLPLPLSYFTMGRRDNRTGSFCICLTVFNIRKTSKGKPLNFSNQRPHKIKLKKIISLLFLPHWNVLP